MLLIKPFIKTHNLFIDDDIILRMSDICMDIFVFESRFKSNTKLEGIVENEYLHGKLEIIEVYKKILNLIKYILTKKDLTYKIELNDVYL